jgi:hypothetical protein
VTVRLHNRRQQGGLGFPAVGGELFEIDAGKSAEISKQRWRALSVTPGVCDFLRWGFLEVEEEKPSVIVPPAPQVKPEAPEKPVEEKKSRRSEKNK